MLKNTTILALFLCLSSVMAQNNDLSGRFHLLDRFGNLVEPDTLTAPPSSPVSPDCSPGWFELYFVNEPGFDPITVDERTLICQVFEDLSALIEAEGTPSVKIEVRNTAVLPSIGTATGYYSAYNNGSSYIPQIYDGLVWEYINTGVDPFAASEGTGLLSGGYNFHGGLKINTSIVFNTEIDLAASGGVHDLYSVVLHEVLHLLGIASFIDVEPFSSDGIYSRYDEHLYIGANQLIGDLDCYTTTSAFSPTSFESTCSTVEVSFIGDNADEPVFSSTSAGSHLSHFQSDCPFNGNLHYVMSAALGVDQTYRLPLQEEIYVLCNLGYQTSGIYGTDPSLSELNYKNDYSSCNNLLVAGVDDAFDVQDDQSYNYTAADFTANDINATGITCVESLGGITVTETAGVYTVDVPITVGIGYYALRYIPKDIADNEGNTTYVFFKVDGGEICDSPDYNEPCNLICGGDFEGFTSPLTPLDYWEIAGNIDSENSADPQAGGVSGTQLLHIQSWEVPNKREGVTFPFNAPLTPLETYTVKFHARKVDLEPSVFASQLRFLISTAAPCDGAVLNNVDLVGTTIPETTCPDGTTFDPIDIGFVTVLSDEWAEYEFTFVPTEPVEHFTLFTGTLNRQFYIDALSVTGPIVGTVNAGEDTQICTDGPGSSLGSPGLSTYPGSPTYLWEPSTGLSADNIPFPLATPVETTTYQLTVSSEDCDYTYIGEVTINVVNCCEVYASELDFSDKTASDVITEYSVEYAGGLFNGETIKINKEFIVDTNIDFLNCNFELGENARIRFVDGLTSSTELNIRNSILQACDEQMWDGIILNNQNHSFSFLGSTLRDAKRGVDISNCASYDLNQNIFRANRIDITVHDCITDEYIGNIINNDFYNESLLAPYWGEEAEHALVAKNMFIVSASENDVFNYDNPFVFENTDIDIRYNSLVHNSSGQTAIAMLFLDRAHKLFSDHNVISDYNIGMTNTLSSVISNKAFTFNITDDSFLKIADKAIYFRNAIGRYNYIKTCSFTDVAYGIIVQSTFPPAPTSSPAPFIDPGKQLTIYDNEFTNVKRMGIFVTNILGSYAEPIGVENKILKIIDNTIALDNLTGATQRAIRIEKCYRARIEGNVISSPGGFPAGQSEKVKGISVSDSRKANIVDNTLSDLGEGLHVIGQNPFTRWECNEMNGCYNGFHFDNTGIGTATYITDQGSSNNPTDNKWIGIGGTNVIGELNLIESSGVQPKWYYREGGNYFPVMTVVTEPYFNLQELPNSFELCNGTYPSPGSGGGTAGAMVSKYEDMLDESKVYNDLNESFKYKDKEYVLREIRGKDLTGESLILDNFFDLMEDSGLDRQMNIHRDMELGDLAAAIERNEAWLTANLHEINSKTVNTIYLNSVAIGMPIDNDDVLTLEEIALTTPYLSGDAVYSARVLLGIDATDNGIQYRHAQVQENSLVAIYPNPSTGLITIDFENHSEKMRNFNCYDITGQLLLSKALSGNQKQAHIDLSVLPSGIYMIQIEEGGNNILQDRLILTQ